MKTALKSNITTHQHHQACDQLETKKKENLTTPQVTHPALIKNIYFSTLKDISYTVRIHTIVL